MEYAAHGGKCELEGNELTTDFTGSARMERSSSVVIRADPCHPWFHVSDRSGLPGEPFPEIASKLAPTRYTEAQSAVGRTAIGGLLLSFREGAS
ncbi:MAG TPA: hypothetical protein VM029_02965, partial [Opitutaceae bacterium]|nr:hypothetical protein [Opitutaceae bacterium]